MNFLILLFGGVVLVIAGLSDTSFAACGFTLMIMGLSVAAEKLYEADKPKPD